MPRNADFIRKLLIKLIWYYTQLTEFVARGPRVLLAMLTAIRKLLIKLIWYYTQLTPFVVRGPRASQC